MSEFEIHKNIAIPHKATARTSKYPFKDLQVGDSFFIPNKKTHEWAATAYAMGKRNGMKYSVRQECSGVRCWRIA